MCTQPITLRVNSCKYSSVYSTQVPCGKCLECLQQKQNEWVVRLYTEALYHSNVLFFTLTYAPESVPELVDTDGVVYRTVYKKHLQDWFKRFRTRYYRRYGKNAQIKYFITSEYGPKTKRPHYHGIIYGVPKKVFNELALSEWNSIYGFTDCQEVRMNQNSKEREKSLGNVMRYVSKYCMKGEFENPLVEQKKVFPTFHLISKGIGKQYTEDVKDFVIYDKNYFNATIEAIVDRSHVKIGNCHYSFPRYFKNKIYGEKTLLSFKVGRFLLDRNDDLYRQKLSQLQTDRHCSDIQAHRVMVRQEDNTKRIEEKKLRDKFAKIYNKSKI